MWSSMVLVLLVGGQSTLDQGPALPREQLHVCAAQTLPRCQTLLSSWLRTQLVTGWEAAGRQRGWDAASRGNVNLERQVERALHMKLMARMELCEAASHGHGTAGSSWPSLLRLWPLACYKRPKRQPRGLLLAETWIAGQDDGGKPTAVPRTSSLYSKQL
jgi:hypothetical protein